MHRHTPRDTYVTHIACKCYIRSHYNASVFITRIRVLYTHAADTSHIVDVQCYIVFSGVGMIQLQVYTGKGFKKNGNPFLYDTICDPQRLCPKTD